MKEDQKCKKMIFGAFSSPGHHFVENALLHSKNKLKMFKIQNLPITRPKVENE